MTITATDLVLAGSLITNGVILFNWAKARDYADMLRHSADGWKASADDWRRLYIDLRANCHRRDPKTGRLMKKGH